VGRVGSSTDLIVQHIEYVSMDEKKNTLLDLISTVEVRFEVHVHTGSIVREDGVLARYA
jgi:ATP-dependent RNA helicase DDX3X